MAIITSPGTRILDASGNPVNGGKFRVYNQNTTTLTTLYSDTALATPRANPVVANSAGELPFFFLASGAYDCAQLDASNNVLDSQDDVPAWGEDTGTLERTVSGNGRFTVTGAAGAVYIQAGPPSPDDVGGDLTIEGQAGTQLDTLTLDAATTNTTGELTVGGKKLPTVVETAGTTFSGAAFVDISLTEQPAGCRMFIVEVIDLKLSTNTASLYGRLGYEGGAVKTGVTDYAYPGTAAAAQIVLAADPEIDVKPGFLRLTIVTPESGTEPTIVSSRLDAYDNTATDPEVTTTAGYGLNAYGRATTLQLRASAGNIAGTYRVMPQRGFGE